MVLRYWYLLRSSWARLIELIYWPAVQMLMWGFLQLYIGQNASFFARASGIFIGAVLLWDILFRGQLGFSMSFLEEMYARNLGNLMMSPLRADRVHHRADDHEHRAARHRLDPGEPARHRVLRVQPVRPWLGAGGVLRQPHPDELVGRHLRVRAWCCATVSAPRPLRGASCSCSCRSTCVYYPVAILPALLQPVAWALPPTYVFEGMRALLIDHVFRADLMLQALALNVLLMAAAVMAFLKLVDSARRQGSLLQTGE